ncbi:hypothetical protein, partial [Campylobacter concisus]|uniref:hypothetical protein n=1 Tax=Campylobacter concisus TaxID=199 RepID=UPI001F16F917
MILQFYVSKPVRSTATSNVRGAYEGADALHAVYYWASIRQILKFHERVISALKFELSCKRSQILVVNS